MNFSSGELKWAHWHNLCAPENVLVHQGIDRGPAWCPVWFYTGIFTVCPLDALGFRVRPPACSCLRLIVVFLSSFPSHFWSVVGPNVLLRHVVALWQCHSHGWSARTEGFSAKHCILHQRAVLFSSPGSGFTVSTGECIASNKYLCSDHYGIFILFYWICIYSDNLKWLSPVSFAYIKYSFYSVKDESP